MQVASGSSSDFPPLVPHHSRRYIAAIAIERHHAGRYAYTNGGAIYRFGDLQVVASCLVKDGLNAVAIELHLHAGTTLQQNAGRCFIRQKLHRKSGVFRRCGRIRYKLRLLRFLRHRDLIGENAADRLIEQLIVL